MAGKSKSSSGTSNSHQLTCPACSYTGHGFNYVELTPNISPTQRLKDGTLLVRLNRAELRHDEIDLEEDRLECPSCGKAFAVPKDIVVEFAERSDAAVAHLMVAAA